MAGYFKIVETDNFGGDYPNETEVRLPYLKEEAAKAIAAIINQHCNHDGQGHRYWKVEPLGYELQPGFAP